MRSVLRVGAVAVALTFPIMLLTGNAAAASCAGTVGWDITDSVRGTLSSDSKTLSVSLTDSTYVLTAVGVRGGGEYELYVGGPYTGMTAPANRGGQTPGISDWFACGVRTREPTPTPSPPGTPQPPTPTNTVQPTSTPTSTPTPTGEPTESPDPTDPTDPTPTEPTREPEPTESPDLTATPEPTSSPEPTQPDDGTESPEASDTPMPVPTMISAGGPPPVSGTTPLSTLMVLGLGAMTAGAAALLVWRRRHA
jgi:hypothetical protein